MRTPIRLVVSVVLIVGLGWLVISTYALRLSPGLHVTSRDTRASSQIERVISVDAPCLALSARIRHDSPAVIFTAGHSLERLSLRDCSDRVVLSRDASAPVRISADGRWIGSGAGIVTPMSGGEVQRPLGRDVFSDAAASTWAWAPTGDTIAGVTTSGAVIVGAPDEQPETVEPADFGATQVVFADSRTLIVVRDNSTLWQVPVTGGRPRLLYRDASRQASLTLATVANGSVIFWRQAFVSASTASDGDPLMRVSLTTGRVRELARGVLLVPGFVLHCGRGLIIAAGGGRTATDGKHIILVSPRWQRLEIGFGVSPACSANGRTIAFAQGSYEHDFAFGNERRRVIIVRLPASSERGGTGDLQPPSGRSTESVNAAPRSGAGADDPMLSPDGRVVLWVQSESEELDAPEGPLSHGALRAAVVSSPGTRSGPIAALGTATDYYGTWSWDETISAAPR